MRLHTESLGQGEDLVMLHGWGMHSAMWGETPDKLAEVYRVTTVDLPGHGRSTTPGSCASLSWWAREVAEVVPQPAVWIGWSLGGLVALRAALDFPGSVSRLVLVATNASFVQRTGWPHAQPAVTLEQFGVRLRGDYRAVLARFLALQVWGCDDARNQLRMLRETLFLHGDPDPDALSAGLSMLRESDLRHSLPAITQPVLLISGQRDTLVPPAAVREMVQLLPDARVEIFPTAGHAPFLKHGAGFRRVVKEFLDG